MIRLQSTGQNGYPEDPQQDLPPAHADGAESYLGLESDDSDRHRVGQSPERVTTPQRVLAHSEIRELLDEFRDATMRDINDRMGDPDYTSAEDRQALVDHTMRRADNMRNTLDEDISTG